MKILVCVKQVPGSNNVEVDPVTGVLKRSGIASKINPYDLYAIETALSLTERFGGTVETLTMGPPQAKAVIQETVCMGAQSGTVLTDRKFAGADVLATAYTLSQGVRKCGDYDLILCGKQTTDGDTAQVGAELSEYLGIPNISNVLSVDDYQDGRLLLTASLDDQIVTLETALPCLISVDGDINTPRLPSYKIRKTLTDDSVKFLTFADFEDQNADHYGLSGSATQVERIFPPEKLSQKQTVEGDADTQAEALYALLLEKKML
ncbi:MAG: electron transfer flavoprotein subunit beta/FixA family protein [Oscillospiraceae bacterium]|nr:electron transfer flavoprotein subunit beta/FixA family protein [Oscillospiraceae bacterium]